MSAKVVCCIEKVTRVFGESAYYTSGLSRARLISARGAIFVIVRVFFLLDYPWVERETASSPSPLQFLYRENTPT